MVQDRDIVPIDDEWEIIYGLSNGRTASDLVLSLKVAIAI